jgi:hypothetical protein
MATEYTEVTLRNRDLFNRQVGLAVISGAKRGKVDLYGTFKYHLSVWRGAVDRKIEMLGEARRVIRDEYGKRDGKNKLVTAQADERNANSAQVIIADPIAHEQAERELLDTTITLRVPVPKLSLDDIRALDFSEQQGDYSGALQFIDAPTDEDEPAAAVAPAAPRKKPAAKRTRDRKEA